MKRPMVILLTALTTLFIFAGCSSKQEAVPAPINEKTDTCEICNMQVKDSPYATQIILDNGKSIVFDDIGCMNEWLEENKDRKLDAAFVRDYSSSDWIEMENAIYVYGQSIKTPMAYNVISFIDKKDAQAFVDQHEGKLLTYKDLEDHYWERNQEMMQEMKKMKMEGSSAHDSSQSHDHNEHEDTSTENSDSSH